MYHHLQRARDIYRNRGVRPLLRTAAEYVPIEINNFVFRLRYGEGTRVIEEDWDTLILLDACRYDMFADIADLKGRLESRISLGSTSEEFLVRNFGDGTYHDTVYVNANGYLPKLEFDRDGTFHAVVDTLSDWDDDLETIRPETVADAAREAHETYPNKRIIVHFMQPHIPFITERGQKLQDELDARSVWTVLRNGGEADVELDRVWNLYRENLGVLLPCVESLLDDIDGKVVVSTDHGNLVGERQGPIPTKRMYGHPWGVYARELVKVPWFVVEREERRRITADAPRTSSTPDPEVTEERLAALGYKE
jgi:hypothetical protein